MLYCITANYTPRALQAMAKNPNFKRSEAVEELVTAAGGKLVAMYGTIVDGPGAMAIIDVDSNVAPAIAALVASSDGIHNLRAQRLFTMDEVVAVRQMRARLQASYRAPGQSRAPSTLRRSPISYRDRRPLVGSATLQP